MKSEVLLRDELIKKIKIDEEKLKDVEKRGIIRPFGYTDDKIPFYSEEVIAQLDYITGMIDLGYSIDEIHKIVKKIGFPKGAGRDISKGGTKKHLTIGELAEKVKVSARTIKHWEEKGIIEADMRSSGGFRLYSEAYVHLCMLIKDLQLFGYSLEQIKDISDHFRDFLVISKNIEFYSREKTAEKLDEMEKEIKNVRERISLFKEGIKRWEELVNKKAREIVSLKKRNTKRKTSGKKSSKTDEIKGKK